MVQVASTYHAPGTFKGCLLFLSAIRAGCTKSKNGAQSLCEKTSRNVVAAAVTGGRFLVILPMRTSAATTLASRRRGRDRARLHFRLGWRKHRVRRRRRQRSENFAALRRQNAARHRH